MNSNNVENNLVDEYEIINIKVDTKQQIISAYSYDENDKLNKDLSEFIVEKSKRSGIYKSIQLNFHSTQSINAEEIKQTVNKHFEEEKHDAKDELKKSNIFIIVMLVFGILTFALLVTLYNKNFTNFYFEMVLEISAWVFIWEAVDNLFLERPKLRRRYILMKKLSVADVRVIANSKLSKGDKNVK